MSVLEYRGISLQVCRFLKGCERTPVYDGPTYLYTRWRINCRCLYNPQATSYDFPVRADQPNSPGPVVTAVVPAQTDQSIRTRLMLPRGQLVLGVGKIAWLVSPQQGFSVDSANGPTPVGCHVLKGPGGRSFVVDYQIETHVRECNLESTFYPSVFLSHRWEMSHALDEDFFTTRIIRGHVIFDTARLKQLVNAAPADPDVIPDQYRGAFFHPIPPNCQRRIPLVKQDADGKTVAYVILDEEQQQNLGYRCANVGITRIAMSHSSEKTKAGVFGWSKSIFGVGAGAIEGYGQGRAGARFRIGEKASGAGAERAIARGAAAGAAAGAILEALKAIGQNMSVVVHAIDVTVWGNAQATRANLLKVARRMADRRGRMVTEIVGGNVGIFSWTNTIHVDMKERVVTVRHQAVTAPSLLEDPTNTGNLWPEMPDTDVLVPEEGVAYIAGQDGTRNALPPGDGRSRGSMLENIVGQALSDPCSFQPAPIPPPAMNPQLVPPLGPAEATGFQPMRTQPA